MLRGGAEKVAEAGACLAGGHSVEDPEPKYGLAVTGVVHPDRVLANYGVRAGDAIVLTKPDRCDDAAARQAEIVDDHLEDAVQKGALIRTGGKSLNLGGGRYMRPTVLTNVTHEMKIMREETFGPVMPVMKYATEEEAVRLANDSIYGLSAAVIAGDAEEAKRIGARLDAGTVCIQDTFLTLFKTFDVESHSFKFSGLGGSRTGPGSILRFFRKQSFLVNTLDPEPFA